MMLTKTYNTYNIWHEDENLIVIFKPAFIN